LNVLAMFPSKYLKAADLGDSPMDVRIESVEVGTVGEGEEEQDRPIVFFHDLKKGLCLNVTNAKRIIALYGSDTDQWAGQWITLYPSECDYKGDTVACIRVKANAPAIRKTAATSKPVKKAPAKGKR
jgi:hypothetical protein